MDVLIMKVEPELLDYSGHLRFASHEKQKSVLRLRSGAKTRLAGDLLIRTEACRRTGLRNDMLVFSQNEYGKPFLQNAPQLHFNLSHTDCFVALSVGCEPSGIDIERVRGINLNIADRFFAPDERDYIRSRQTEGERFEAFFEIWTKKESFMKREGTGMSMPLRSFSVLAQSPLNYHRIINAGGITGHLCCVQKEAPNIINAEMREMLKLLVEIG